MARTGGLSLSVPVPSIQGPATGRRRALLLSGAVVTLLHLALLLGWRSELPAAQPGAGAPGGQAVAETTVRLPVRLRAMPESRPLSPAPAATAGSMESDHPPAPAPTPRPQMIELAEPASAAPSASDSAAALTTDPELYLPRSALTQGASAIGMVQIPYPADTPPGLLRIQALLYIDEHGSVQRVRIDSPAPASLQEAIRQSFLNARFLPGELHGRPVRSRMRIEVEFSNELLPAAPAAASGGEP
ncbi:MAG: hypothetical protein RJA44_2343 [Pseudomonadota bacterium]